jgi:hypothetical protein
VHALSYRLGPLGEDEMTRPAIDPPAKIVSGTRLQEIEEVQMLQQDTKVIHCGMSFRQDSPLDQDYLFRPAIIGCNDEHVVFVLDLRRENGGMGKLNTRCRIRTFRLVLAPRSSGRFITASCENRS